MIGLGLPEILVLGAIVFSIASMWVLYAKAGEPGWAALIPIYNLYILLKIAGKPGWWLLLMLIPFVSLVIAIITYIGVAKNFGKGGGFAFGLVLLPYVFFPILAFGSAEYIGSNTNEYNSARPASAS